MASVVTGTLLISSQIKSNCLQGTKAASEETSPPKDQMVSVQGPLTPPALALSCRAARALGETGHPAYSQSTLEVHGVH